MKAVILSAGLGSRLRPLTAETPKCLVRVAGLPILGHLAAALRGSVDEIIVVTGYRHEEVAAFAGGRWTIVHNPAYDATSSLQSLMLAREAIGDSPFVLTNGDLVMDASIVRQLIAHPAATATLVDDRATLRDREMNVVIRDGSLVAISKRIRASEADAQSLQLTKFGVDDARRLFARAADLVQGGEREVFPADAYDRIIAESQLVPVYRHGGIWFEIDTLADLAACEAELMAPDGVGAAHDRQAIYLPGARLLGEARGAE